MLIGSPVLGLGNGMKQSIGGTTKLQERKSLSNKSKARALIELLKNLGLITTIPWLTYEKLVVEPELEREKKSLKSQCRDLKSENQMLEESIRVQQSYNGQIENNYLTQINQMGIEISQLNLKLQNAKNSTDVTKRTDLYEKLIKDLASLYPDTDPLEKTKFVYRCQVFVYGLEMLPWICDTYSLFTLVQQIDAKMARSNAPLEYLAVINLLAGEKVYTNNVLGAKYTSVECMMYLIFGSELPEGIETAKKIWETIEKSNYEAVVPYLACDEHGTLVTNSIRRNPKWEIYRTLLDCENSTGYLTENSNTAGLFLNSNSGLLLEQQSFQEEQIPKKQPVINKVKIEDMDD